MSGCGIDPSRYHKLVSALEAFWCLFHVAVYNLISFLKAADLRTTVLFFKRIII